MPPKLKKVGRPIGSKTRKGRWKSSQLLSTLKEIRANIRKSIKVEDAPRERKDNFKKQYSDPDDPNLSIRNIENNKVIYNCKKCTNKNFKFKKSYEEHMLLEHSTTPGSVECSQCPIVCPDYKTLEAHIIKVHERTVFNCEYCGKEFVRQAHVLRHMAQKGCDGSIIASFPCEICSATFTRKDNLIVHLRHMHISRALLTCKQPNCDFASKNFTKLIRHWHANHAEVPHRFECDYCGKSTMSRAAMAKHLEIHGEKKYACDVCGYSTYTIEVMRRHILTHVEDKPYKCVECGSSYIQRAQLDRHMDKHVADGRAPCELCGDVLDCKAKLLIHKRKKHDGILRHLCPFKECLNSKKEFFNEEGLLNHINRQHLLKNKVWSCEVCKKQFSTEINMRRHLSTHTLDRPRRCMYCVSARAYVRGQQLVRHVRKFHPDVFRTHLAHVRNVLVTNPKSDRVTKSEMESILTILDAESERILEGCSGTDILYGGLSVTQSGRDPEEEEEDSPLMSEEMLAENLGNLLEHLIDEDTLKCLGWPEESVDNILERVIEQCGAKPADRDMWSRVQRLRENAKHLFLYVVDDKSISMMLGTHTIDQIVKHILHQVQADGGHTSVDGAPYGDNKEIEIELAVT